MKPENILIFKEKKFNICDFGLSESNLTFFNHQNYLIGTPGRFCPEVNEFQN